MNMGTPAERNRGGCLTAFFVFMLAVSPLDCFTSQIGIGVRSFQLAPMSNLWRGSDWVVEFYFCLRRLEMKEMGRHWLVVTAVAFFALNLGRGALIIISAVFGLAIAPAILVQVVSPVWEKME